MGVTINKKPTTTEPPPYNGQQTNPQVDLNAPTGTKSSPQHIMEATRSNESKTTEFPP